MPLRFSFFLSLVILVGPVSAEYASQKLQAATQESSDKFGYSVSVHEDLVLVGGPGFSSKTTGKASVFAFDEGQWVLSKNLIPNNLTVNTEYGYAVDINAQFAVVSARHDADVAENSGAVYVFEFVDGDWTETDKLKPAGVQANDRFGKALSLYENRLMVTSNNDDNDVYVYEHDGVSWAETGRLSIPNGLSISNFGTSISLSDQYAVIGAHTHQGSGTVFIFENLQEQWGEAVELTPSDGVSGDNFGVAVAVDGDFVMVGATHKDNDNGVFSAGAVYAFKNTNGSWHEIDKISLSVTPHLSYFGKSVSLYKKWVVIGASGANGNTSTTGAIYLYKFNGDGWLLHQKLLAEDGESLDRFGASAHLSEKWIITGAPQHDFGVGASLYGAAYVVNYDDIFQTDFEAK